MSTSGASLPSSVLPMPGFSWPPVMAVVRLSRMMVTTLLLVVGDVEEGGDAGVEERAVADDRHRAVLLVGVLRPCTLAMPWAMLMPAPMQVLQCMASNGGSAREAVAADVAAHEDAQAA